VRAFVRATQPVEASDEVRVFFGSLYAVLEPTLMQLTSNTELDFSFVHGCSHFQDIASAASNDKGVPTHTMHNYATRLTVGVSFISNYLAQRVTYR
jgi:hypothetical protein